MVKISPSYACTSVLKQKDFRRSRLYNESKVTWRQVCFSKKLISEPSVDDDIESIKVGAKKCTFFFLVVCSWSLTAGHTFALLLVMHRLGNEMIKVIGNRYFSKKKKKTGNLFCPRFSAQSGQIIL